MTDAPPDRHVAAQGLGQHPAAGPSAGKLPLVKICGLTRAEDALLAAELGAWALGFILAPSPRRVTPEAAAELVALVREAAPEETRRPLTVGVFVDTSSELVQEIAEAAGLDGVQLHGEESPEMVRAVRRLLPERLIMKALPVEEDGSGISSAGAFPANGDSGGEARAASGLARLAASYSAADALLLDTRCGGAAGGTGRTFPWGLARAAAGRCYLVAGGLTPDNASLALAASGASGVDVCSGVEAAPGIKNEARLRALFTALGYGLHDQEGCQ